MSLDKNVTTDEALGRLETWLSEQLGAPARIENANRIEFGHSAEMLSLTVVSQATEADAKQDLVIRLRPTPPGILEPYDLQKQYDILRALELTPVRSPRALWIEPTGDVLGRAFYVMEKLPGDVHERERITDHDGEPGERALAMTQRCFEQLALIHQVDLKATGLDSLGDGAAFLDRELDRWADEMHKWQRGPLPALERLLAELRAQQPAPSPYVTLVHGDVKPGNFAFVEDEVSAIFDWEMSTVGDPLTDIGWAEMCWRTAPAFQAASRKLDGVLEQYEQTTGITLTNRGWYRAMQSFKTAVILLIGSMQFDAGISNDPRYAEMALAVPYMTDKGLKELGVEEELDPGPVSPRPERMQSIGGTT